MTKKIKNTSRLKILAVFLAMAIFCFGMFIFTSCKASTSSDKDDPSFKPSAIENIVANASFEDGISAKATNFPISASSSWSLTNDSSSSSSNINSGVVKVTDDGWKQTITNLYGDSDFKNFISKKYDLDFSNMEKEDAVNLIISKFPSPMAHASATEKVVGKHVYMINNYKNNYNGFGAAQRITTTSSITIENGTYGKISVWVKTANITEGGSGANIRLVNTLNNVTQDSYNIYNINTENVTTNNGWKEYVIYVKADEIATTTVKISVGLGMGNGSNNGQFYTEGTVFVDDISYAQITASEFNEQVKNLNLADKKVVNYVSSTSSNSLKVADTTGDYYLYSLSVEESLNQNTTDYIKDLNFTAEGKFTSSSTANGAGLNEITSQTIFGTNNSTVDLSKDSSSVTLSNIKNAAYTLTINSSDFKVEYESYFYLTFKVQNKLSKLDFSDGIKIYVHDVYGAEEDIITANETTFEKGEQWTTVNILLQNNFPDDASYIDDKQFFIVITIGPDVVNTDSTFANGESVILKDFKYAIGEKSSDAEYHNFYSLFTSISSPIALINGEGADFSDSSNSEYYNLTVAPSDSGTITAYPSIPGRYTGITSNNVYVNKNGTDVVTDGRSGNVSGKSHAGLINTKYLNNYETISGLENIKTALAWSSTTENIQPLMIYNDTEDSYGYIGETTYVAASSDNNGTNAITIEVSLKVVGDAKAFIYLIDLSSEEKDVMTIDVVSNTNGAKYQEEVNFGTKKLSFESITETNGWVTYKIYVVHGTKDKNIRLEIWNGSRDGQVKSKGYVFFNGINSIVNTTTISPSDYTDIVGTSNPIAENYNSFTELHLYKPVLTEKEKEYNKKHPDSAVFHSANYIWAKSDYVIYAAYNLVDPIVVDPFETDTDNDSTDTKPNETNPAAFWLSFSSIILGVALAVAIIALIIKNVRKKRSANASDAKAHYNVKSRAHVLDSIKKRKETENKNDTIHVTEEEKENEDSYTVEDTVDNIEEFETNNESNEPKETLDEYVYNDVQDFGDFETNQDKTEE